MKVSAWKAKKSVFDAVQEGESRVGLKSSVGVIRPMSQEDDLCSSNFNGLEGTELQMPKPDWRMLQ